MGDSAAKPPPAARRASAYSHPKLDQHQLRTVAVQAKCDPRTVVKYLRGKDLSSTMRARIEEALCALRLEPLIVVRPGDAWASARAQVNVSSPPPSSRGGNGAP